MQRKSTCMSVCTVSLPSCRVLVMVARQKIMINFPHGVIFLRSEGA